MAPLDTLRVEIPHKSSGLLRDQIQLIKRKDSDRYEMVSIPDTLSLEKGFFIVLRACQLLAQKNDGLILVGVAGPSGAGKTVFTNKVVSFMPSVAVITMDNYNDSSRVIDGNFDDPRLTDYDTLLENIKGLKAGKPVQVPIYDFKSSSRTGYRTVEVPSSRIVIIEGIYALSEKLRPLLDLRVSITGGVHFDLVKRVLRDIQRAGQEPEEIIHQISETVYPMYKAFIEPDLQTAHIKITNKFNPFSGFQNPTYILKSTKAVTEDQIRDVIVAEHTETTEETYDIYLLPPGEDPEACQSYLRMRNRDGKYNLMFEEWVTDSPFIISPRITFEVSVRLLGGLMALGYTIAAILKRNSHIFHDDKVSVKIDWLEQLKRSYVQVQGRDRNYVKHVAEKLGLDGSYVPRTYIEQIQLDQLINDVMALPDDLKTQLSIVDDNVSSPKEAISRVTADKRTKFLRTMSHSFSRHRGKGLPGRAIESPAAVANQGIIMQLSDQISTLNERMDEFTSRIEELNSTFANKKLHSSQQNLPVHGEACNGLGPTSLHHNGIANSSMIGINGLANGSINGTNGSSASLVMKDSLLFEEVVLITRGQCQIMSQLDALSNLLHEYLAQSGSVGQANEKDKMPKVNFFPIVLPLAIGAVGLIWLKGLAPKG